MWSPGRDLNPRPTAFFTVFVYKAVALRLSYRGTLTTTNKPNILKFSAKTVQAAFPVPFSALLKQYTKGAEKKKALRVACLLLLTRLEPSTLLKDTTFSLNP